MNLLHKRIGFALTGSFCTIDEVLPQIKALVAAGATVTPIVSHHVATIDTRFGQAHDLMAALEAITSTKVMSTIAQTEPIGPRALLDLLIVAPCTGNTLAKIAHAITDTSVTMAVKAHLRNARPVVLSVSTNDGLAANAKNIGQLLNTNNIYFVPFYQDNPIKKSNSLLSKNALILATLEKALDGEQLQPLLLTNQP